jgi:hypothetical protein
MVRYFTDYKEQIKNLLLAAGAAASGTGSGIRHQGETGGNARSSVISVKRSLGMNRTFS